MSRKHVVIVGAGPAGLLLAHGLLAQPDRFRIDVIEAGGRADAFAPGRACPLVLGVRGRAALQSCDGGQLWAAVSPLCAHVSQLIEHGADGAISSRVLPTAIATVSRAALVDALLRRLEARILELRSAGHFPMVSVRFDTKVMGVELDARLVRLADVSSPGGRRGMAYDVLIGADGQDSPVRAALIARPGCNFKAEWVSSACRVMRVATDALPMLEPHAVHTLLPRTVAFDAGALQESGEAEAAPPSEGAALVTTHGALALAPHTTMLRELLQELRTPAEVVVNTVPVHDGTMLTVFWSAASPPAELLALRSPAQLQRWLRAHFPVLAPAVDEAAATQFLAQKPGYARTIYLNTFHDRVTRACCVLGDAAHAAAPVAGQATAAALADAALLARLLSEAEDSRDAVAAFSDAAVPQGHALVRLSSALPALAPLAFEPWVRSLDRAREQAVAALAKRLGDSKLAHAPRVGAWLAATLGGSALEPLLTSEEPFERVLQRHRVGTAFAMLANGFRDGAVF